MVTNFTYDTATDETGNYHGISRLLSALKFLCTHSLKRQTERTQAYGKFRKTFSDLSQISETAFKVFSF